MHFGRLSRAKLQKLAHESFGEGKLHLLRYLQRLRWTSNCWIQKLDICDLASNLLSFSYVLLCATFYLSNNLDHNTSLIHSSSHSGYPVINDPLYNHVVFGPEKGKGGRIGKSDEKLIADLISIHNAENWLGLDEDGLGPVQPGSIIGQNIQLREPEGETFYTF